MNKEVLFSSAKDDWETPAAFFDQLNQEFKFDLDAAANAANHKTYYWLGPGSILAEDALAVKWAAYGASIWCNPPYGRGIGQWVEKAAEAGRVATVVMLLPARTDTKWFHDFAIFGEIRFIRGRLKFEGAPAPAPFPSMLVIFRPEIQTPFRWVTLR